MSDLIEHEKPGFFERWGIRYFYKLSATLNQKQERYAPTDSQLVSSVRRITWLAALGSFAMGAVSAGGSVLAEQLTLDRPFIEHYLWIGGVTLILTAIEFYILFVIAIHTVFHISRVIGHQRLESRPDLLGSMIPNLLARAALEIPDPVQRILGIDPLAQVSKKKMMLVGFLYKVKVVFSNVLAKLVLKRLLAKSTVRVLAFWVSVPITGLWNAIVAFKVAREARIRLFGYLLAEHIATHQLSDTQLHQLSPKARLGCLQAVGNAVVLTQNYHPNMLILLVRVADALNVKEGTDFANWSTFLQTLAEVNQKERNFLCDLLAVATAFDGHFSTLEKQKVPEAFGENTKIYVERIEKLIRLLKSGRLNQAIDLCELDFNAG